MSASPHDIVAGLIARAFANPAAMSPWEAEFVADFEAKPRLLSPKRIAALERVANRMAASGLAALLGERAEELATALKGMPPSFRGRDDARWGARRSFSVVTAGEDRGSFYDHEAGAGGDALGMVAHLRRCSFADAITWAQGWLRLEGLDPAAALPAPVPLHTARAAIPKQTVPLARSIWRDALAAAGTPVETYLVNRGLSLPANAPLRFHRACPRDRERLPAMIALMTDPVTAEPVGVHRTFLRPDGSGKAAGHAKMMLGGAGIIRLVPDEEVSVGLGLAEGIETALSVMQGAGWSPVWAAGNAGAIGAFPVLSGLECLSIFADHDLNGAGTKAARGCAARWAGAGREVTVHCPPAGIDWNDIIRSAA